MAIDTPTASTPPSDFGMIKGDDNGLDIRALQDISREETIEEEKAAPVASKSKVKTEKVESTDASKSVDSAVAAVEGSEDSSEEASTEEAGEDSSGEEKEGIEVRQGDKVLKLDKDSEVSVKIDGKVEKMSLQEVLNKASGVVNVERENSRLGRERKQLETKIQEFEQETMAINANAQALLDITDPMEFCEYYASLKGMNAQKVYEQMVDNVAKHLERLGSMTPRELELERENRAYRRQQKAAAAKQKVQESQQQRQQTKEALENELKSEGLTGEDYLSALEELKEKINKGESLGEYLDNLKTITEADIVDYAVERMLNKRITSAVQSVNKELLTDTDFVKKISAAVYKTERLHGKMSDAEVAQVVKRAVEIDNKKLSENLVRKVKSKATTSQSVTSHKQDEDEGPATLEEYYERNRRINVR